MDGMMITYLLEIMESTTLGSWVQILKLSIDL